MKIRLRLTTIVLILLVSCPSAFSAWREPVRAKHAIVASQHPIASSIGVQIMRRGGNAVDAAVAVGLALAVVYPEAGNLGGGGFMIIRLADGRTTSIDYREMAPEAATRNIFVDESGNLIRGEGGSVLGYRAAGIPGTPAGLEYAFRKYGSGNISWSEIVEPSRRIAKNGFVLTYRLAELFKTYKENLSKYEDSRKIFLNNGNYFEEGDILRQPELARTLKRIQEKGSSDFYSGQTASLIAADMALNNGLMTLGDLARYKVKEREPIVGTYRGNTLISMPPPSSGGIVLVQVLNMLEKYDLKAMGHNSASKYHLLIEAMRRSFADRAEYMGDPDFAEVPIARLVDKAYLQSRGSTIKSDKATPSTVVGPGKISIKEGMDTTHYSVIDKHGNVVSNTYTINNIYGSAVTAKGTGVLLNDEMDDFAAKPGEPNLFGLVQGEQNAVGPMKRPLSSMTPTIVLRPNGTFWFAIGARGGPRIISAVIQATINVIDHQMNIQQAIDAPRIHHQWLPDEILWEEYGLSGDTRSVLEKYGHRFSPSPRYIASATAVAMDESGVRFGAIDGRSDGEAMGY